MFTLEEVCSYTRQHNSKGEQKFTNHFLLPMISAILKQHKLTDKAVLVDGIGNIWVTLAPAEEHSVLFCAHIDTCHTEMDERIEFKNVEGYLVPNGKLSCAGFDDGVGMYVNLKLMEAGVKGTYLFTRGEEKGLVGASWIADNHPEWLSQYLMCIEVDRQGTKEVVISQYHGDTASVEFGKDLIYQLNMGHELSDEGIYTDNAAFAHLIPECVNIAAGYSWQHTKNECCNPLYVEALVERMIEVEWDALNVQRTAGDFGQTEDDPLCDYYRYTSSYVNNNAACLTYEELCEIIKNEPEVVAQFLYEHDVTMEELYGGDF